MKLRTLAFYLLALFACGEITASNDGLPRLLIKIPTRSRPELLFKTLNLFYKNLSKSLPYNFLISCDTDDETMNNETVIKKLNRYPHLYYYFGNNTTKVEAYNADIDKHPDFDILLVAHDNIESVIHNFDITIARNMLIEFPDYDGILNFYDKQNRSKINTFPVIGKKYYNQFGYIYAPHYRSSWCKNELADISRILKKERRISEAILKKNTSKSNLINKSHILEKVAQAHSDRLIYINRRNNNFNINPKILDQITPKMWSILICTLENREKSFNHIYAKLQNQIADLGLQDQIEVLYFKDNRENSVGFKRNRLLEQSCGKYICYVDDDDDVSDDYIKVIYEKLLQDPDCIELQGIITFDGHNPKLFIHSIKYTTYFEKNNIYYRPPNHLNPIRRILGCQFLFPSINRSEDTDWAMQIAKTGLLKHEEEINKPYYFYLFDELKQIDKK